MSKRAKNDITDIVGSDIPVIISTDGDDGEAPDYSSRPMSWHDFKRIVDTWLREKGIGEGVSIDQIHITFPTVSGYKSDELTIEVDEFGLYIGDEWDERNTRSLQGDDATGG